MNKKEIASMKKEFKLGSVMLNIKEIYSVYLKKDNGEIIHSEFSYFDKMEEEKQELYLNNFKKVLSGTIDTKLFQLNFENLEGVKENSQEFLCNLLEASEEQIDLFKENADNLVEKIYNNCNYDTDIVITLIKGEYWKAKKKLREEADESIDDYVQALRFTMGSINKIDAPKSALKFDYKAKEFKANSSLESVINLNNPIEGFMFPNFNGGYEDVNNIIYYTSKAKAINTSFVKDVLNCNLVLTAEDEKENFINILNAAADEQITPAIMQEIYEKLYIKSEDEDEEEIAATLDIKDLKRILSESGIESTDNLENAFEEIVGAENYDFKIRNIIPDFNAKSVKITNSTSNITVMPKDLSTIKQVKNKEGKKYLMIEIEEDVVINGVKVKTEELN